MGEDGQPGWAPNGSTRQEAAPRVAAVQTTTNIPTTNSTAIPAPPILSRAAWGADETIRENARQYAPIRKLIVHHTASDNRPADPAAVVRETYQYHVQGRGFSDIGYNFMIDHRGVIYEGRFARYYGSTTITGEDRNGWGVVGAHAAHYNHGSCGVCLIGNFELGAPSDAALTALTWLLAWKAGRNGIDLLADGVYENYYGRFFDFENLSGHRDVGFTLCPGRLLYAQLGAVRAAAVKQAGHFDPLVVDIPAVVRNEFGPGRGPAPATSAPVGGDPAASTTTTPATTTTTTTPATTTSAPATTATGGTAPKHTEAVPTNATATTAGAAPKRTDAVPTKASTTSPSTTAPTATATGATSTSVPPTPATPTGYRAATADGLLMNTAHATGHGKPGAAVVGLAAPGVGDGYAAVAASGKVFSFGNVAAVGDANGKGTAVDIATTRSGQGYWVLMNDGAIYPFGDARYFGSPKRSGLKTSAVAIEARPAGDGYWVLGADGSVRGYGAARSFGPATGSGQCVDLAITPTGNGCYVLFDSGAVAAFGDAVAAGDLATTTGRWTKPAAAITAVPATNGYVLSARDGGLFTFGGAPFFGSFAGSGATVIGLAVACR